VDKAQFLEYFPNSYGEKSLKRKIIIKGLTLLDACIDLKGEIIPGKSTMMIPASEETLYLLMGIINSKIMIFYVKQKYASSSYNGGSSYGGSSRSSSGGGGGSYSRSSGSGGYRR
jgi:hypothetical protein